MSEVERISAILKEAGIEKSDTCSCGNRPAPWRSYHILPELMRELNWISGVGPMCDECWRTKTVEGKGK